MTGRPIVGSWPKTAVVITVILAVLGGGGIALAQAEAAADAPPAAAAAPADAAAPQPPEEAPAGQRLFYANPLWLLLIVAAVCMWLYVTSWVGTDARGVGMDYPVISALMLAAGAAGMVFTVLFHAAFAFLIVVLVLIAFNIYIVQRNKMVPEQHKFLGPHHRAELFSKIPVINKISAFEPRLRAAAGGLPLTNDDGLLLSDLTAEQPSLSRAADILADMVLRAGIAASPRVRLQSSGEQYVTQFLLDGMVRNVEAFDAEVSQQILGCASQFTGLTKEGRMRQGSSRIYAELPGRGKTEIGVQITAVGGKPALVFNLPDWSADIYKSGLPALGMHEAVIRRLQVALRQNEGAVVFCSEPGMGKTTTLYAAVGALDIFTTDVFAIEKQEERELNQVRRWTIPTEQPFSQFFSAVLRENPHSIMFGELETAEQARGVLEFATSEGQVLTTLRSVDAPNGMVRLVQLAGDGSLVSGAVTCALGQKLVRTLCTNCREQIEPNPALLRRLELDPAEPGSWYRPVGCEACLSSGYRGRIAMYSMLIVTDPVKKVLEQSTASPADIRQAAGKTAFRTMYQDGISKVAAGVTTLDEIRRVLKPT